MLGGTFVERSGAALRFEAWSGRTRVQNSGVDVCYGYEDSGERTVGEFSRESKQAELYASKICLQSFIAQFYYERGRRPGKHRS